MLVNRTKLKVEMLKNNIPASKLAKELGITSSSLSLKMSGKRYFNEDEIEFLTSVFGYESIF